VTANRIAIVTGATSGIGLAIAQELAGRGYTIVGIGRSAEKIDALKERFLRECPGATADFRAMDIRDTAATRALAEQIARVHGGIGALVNAAGLIRLEPTHEVVEKSFDEQFNTLFRGTFFLTTAVLRHMIAAGGGVIVNIASVAAEKASPKMAVYAAAKAALVNFTKTVALEYADKGIRAVCISPGAVQTNLMDKVILAMIQKRTPLKRLAQPAEVAALVRFVLSEEGSYLTGATLTMDGGSGL
jgi:3-oxoacyl-[acyl-carrier protein] reductase